MKCDLLPLYVEVRFDACHEDYTGLGKPGVWHLEPTTDDWKFPQKKCSQWIIPMPPVPTARHHMLLASSAEPRPLQEAVPIKVELGMPGPTGAFKEPFEKDRNSLQNVL